MSRIAVNWWLRSPNASNSNNFVNVNTDGTVNNTNAYNSLAFAPGFCPIARPINPFWAKAVHMQKGDIAFLTACAGG